MRWSLLFVAVLTVVSCKKGLKAEKTILAAEMKAPMGRNYLRIYEDSTFQFEYRSFVNEQ